MQILTTGADTELGQAVTEHVGASHSVRVAMRTTGGTRT